MRILECEDLNNNSYYLIELVDSLTESKEDYYWAISDLNLVPVFKGDYSGIGSGKEEEGPADMLLKAIEKSKVVILDYGQLMQLLYDTLTVRNAVLICLKKTCRIDLNTFRPKVEYASKEMYDRRAIYEIRILDGDLFFVLTE